MKENTLESILHPGCGLQSIKGALLRRVEISDKDPKYLHTEASKQNRLNKV